MIDFSNYPELDPFTLDDNTIDNNNNPEPEFKEAPFNLRRQHYINYLNDRENKLYQLITLAQTSGLDQVSRNIQFILGTPSSLVFRLEQPEATSGNCLGTDQVYDFYRNILQFGSRLEGLGRYNEQFIELYEDTYNIGYQIFNKIGTRGQLYGYLDKTVIDYGNILDTFIQDLENSNTTNDMLNIIAANENSFINSRDTFRTNILAGASDMREIINPVVKYLNLIDISSKIIGLNWATIGPSEKIKNIFYVWNKTIYDFDGDYIPKYKAIASQINEQMLPMIKEDKSNLELIITKSIKLAFDETGITTDLIQTESEFIIPNY